MAENTFHLSVVTPERSVLECEASFVSFPAHNGEMGIMRRRAPLLARLGIGRLKAETENGEREFFIDGGFAQMVENRLTILTEAASDPSEIDRAAAEEALSEARELQVTDERSFKARQDALERARVQLRLAG